MSAKTEYKIDASGRSLGRVATEAASILNGKNSANFSRNKVSTVKVTIINARNLHIAESKRRGKIYVRYSGYPGGLRKERLEEMIAKKSISEPIRLAVYGMIPSNKLRKEIMSNLIIEE